MNAVPPAPTHWAVRMNYRNRGSSFLLAFAIMAVHMWDRGYGPGLWGFAGLLFLVYPHLAFLLARRAGDPLKAELRNMLCDNFCFGAWTALLGFPLWICFMLVVGGCMHMAAFGAVKGVLRALAGTAAGALLVAAAGAAAPFAPDTTLPVSLMSMASLSVYLVLFARSAHARTVALHETRRKLRQSEVALQGQLEAVQSLQAQLTERANRDPLTGLYNRRYLDDSLQRELDRCARDGQALSLMLIDLDYFKKINDRHGHAIGDEVLRQVSARLLQSMRSSDICCRYGGEEFLLALPHAGFEAAIERAEQCRSSVAAQPCLAEGQSLPVTLSIGVACSPDSRMAPAELIELADRALYRAKAEGRNRVCRAPLAAAAGDADPALRVAAAH